MYVWRKSYAFFLHAFLLIVFLKTWFQKVTSVRSATEWVVKLVCLHHQRRMEGSSSSLPSCFPSWPVKLYSALITRAPLPPSSCRFLLLSISLSLLVKHNSGLNLVLAWSNICHYPSHTSLLPSVYFLFPHHISLFLLCPSLWHLPAVPPGPLEGSYKETRRLQTRRLSKCPAVDLRLNSHPHPCTQPGPKTAKSGAVA